MSKTTGAVILIISTLIFILFTFWILFTPFLDVDVDIIRDWFPPREWATQTGIAIFVVWSFIVMFSLGYILTQNEEHSRNKSRLKKYKQ